MRYLEAGDRVLTNAGSGVIDGFVVDEDGEVTAMVVLDDEDSWCTGATGWIDADSLVRVTLQ